MAYKKQTWANGDVITAEKLNHIEEGIENGDNGYECIEAREKLFEGSVSTSGDSALGIFYPPAQFEADRIYVSFNDVVYTCEKTVTPYSNQYGNIDEYPFVLDSQPSSTVLYTKNSGTYALIVEKDGYSATPTDCFNAAVNESIKTVFNLNNGIQSGSVRSINAKEEDETYMLGKNSFAFGEQAEASGTTSYAEGNYTKASGNISHAEGFITIASGASSHAEGEQAEASGGASHAEGSYTKASGYASHVEGSETIAAGLYQHVQGKYNIEDNNNTYAEIVGNGTGRKKRSNARTLDWDGNETLQGSLTLGKGSADETTVTAAQLKALIALLNA